MKKYDFYLGRYEAILRDIEEDLKSGEIANIIALEIEEAENYRKLLEEKTSESLRHKVLKADKKLVVLRKLFQNHPLRELFESTLGKYLDKSTLVRS